MSVIRNKSTPEFVKSSYPLVWAKETCFMRDVATSILTDILTAKSIEEIGTVIVAIGDILV